MIDNEKKTLSNKERYDISDLLDIMRILRSQGGCPWDAEQTHTSLRKNLVEECYEVCEAIDNNDAALLREELGDLLFQVVFHARIAEEDGLFDFSDVVHDIAKKMVVRHDHVFGDKHYESLDEQLKGWDAIKMQTKNQETLAKSLDSVARTLPSLMRAQKLAHKLEKYGVTYDIENIDAEDGAKEIYRLCADMDKQGIDAERTLYDLCEGVIDDMKNNLNK